MYTPIWSLYNPGEINNTNSLVDWICWNNFQNKLIKSELKIKLKGCIVPAKLKYYNSSVVFKKVILKNTHIPIDKIISCKRSKKSIELCTDDSCTFTFKTKKITDCIIIERVFKSIIDGIYSKEEYHEVNKMYNDYNK